MQQKQWHDSGKTSLAIDSIVCVCVRERDMYSGHPINDIIISSRLKGARSSVVENQCSTWTKIKPEILTLQWHKELICTKITVNMNKDMKN